MARLSPLFAGTFANSTRGTLVVARTAWLGVFCLLGLGPFIFVKVVTGASTSPVAADIVDAKPPPPVTAILQEDTLAKADRLPVFKQTDTRQASTVSLAAVAPADVVEQRTPNELPKIVGRHWHEGRSLVPKPTRRSASKKGDTTIASTVHANGR